MTISNIHTIPLEETLAVLGSPVDQRHVRQRKQGAMTLEYIPWGILAKCLHNRVPGWMWELLEVKQIGDHVVD